MRTRPAIPPGFELYQRRRSRRPGPAWVHIGWAGQTLAFSAGAWEQLGRPAAVVLLVERAERLIGFRAARPGEAHARKVSGPAHQVSAGPLLRYMAPVPAGRHELRAVPGLPAHISLDHEPAPKRTYRDKQGGFVRYETLAALRDAYAAGQVTEPMMLDNDQVTVYQGGEKVFDSHPDTVLEAALDLLGISHEHV